MTVLFSFFLLILVIYIFFLVYYAIGFVSHKTEFQNNEKDEPIGVSVIICAHNEAAHIGKCLSEILKQNYDFSKVQIIVINDASNDKTPLIAEHILKNSKTEYIVISNKIKKGKKKSITMAVKQYVKYTNIILRDADTHTYSTLWLACMTRKLSKGDKSFIIGPLGLSNNFGLLWAMQVIEQIILGIITCGSSKFKKAFLCNGANLAFTKSVFNETLGYNNHINIEGGDDVLFLEDVKRLNDVKISYLKSQSAMVYTYPQKNLSKLIHQRVRWAHKFKFNPNPINTILGAIVLITNMIFLFCLIYSFFVPKNTGICLIFILTKLFFDFLLLFLGLRFFKYRIVLFFYLPLALIYPIYAIIVGVLSVFKKVNYKSVF
ncbi:MAG: glycosyltransferase [Bacteroidetes bacterium]|nr:glycosyltransferase [Bacteroidota bacterium]